MDVINNSVTAWLRNSYASELASELFDEAIVEEILHRV